MKLVVGLGNPGRRYARTRHNIGWRVVDALAGPKTAWQESKKMNAEYYRLTIGTHEVELLKPLTFMNASGTAVVAVAKKHRLPRANILVVHDDKDLPFGTVRVAQNSRSAGQRGVQSIIDALGSQEFTRVRVGIGNPALAKTPTDEFVLQPFTAAEEKQLPTVIQTAVETIEKLLTA